MMLEELRHLFAHIGPSASRIEYEAAIIDENVLGKPSRKARELTFRHMVALYGFDQSIPIFRVFSQLWSMNPLAQPLLSLSMSLARDALLRASFDFMLNRSIGSIVRRNEVEDLLRLSFPGRFSAASLTSFAQNISGTWTAAGILKGYAPKVRVQPAVHAEVVTFLLFLAYLEGRSGQRLFASNWLSLLDIPTSDIEGMASVAANRGLLVFMNAGGVKEVRFPGYLTHEEELIQREIADGI